MKQGLIAILIFFCCSAHAQDTIKLHDTTALKEAFVHGVQPDWVRPESQLVDSALLASFAGGNMGDLLRMGQPMHVKSYGNAGLATVAYRGLDATALNLMWKGAKINSSLNGMVDLSIVPVFFFDGAEIYSNTVNSSNLSGSVGADLVLKSASRAPEADIEEGVTVETGMGSFGKGYGGVKYREWQGGFDIDARIYYSQSQNNYEYKPIDFQRIGEILYLENAATLTFGGLLSGKSVREKGSSEFAVMLMGNHRELPATLLESASVKEQSDIQSVWVFNRDWKLDKGKVEWNNSYTAQSQEYSDSNANIESTLKTQIYQNSLKLKRSLNESWTLATGVSSYFAAGQTDNYHGSKTQFFIGQNTSVKYLKEGLKLQAGVKSLLVQDVNLWFMPLVSVAKNLNKHQTVHALFERSGRLPTLNEMHWDPGGKVDLQAMSSDKLELGFKAHKDGWNLSQIVYLTNVNRYIEWLPSSQSANFEVVQHRFVRAAGSESMLSYTRKGPLWFFQANFTYNHTRSVYGRDLNDNNQRILVPINTGSFSFQFTRKNFNVYYIHSFTSERYLDVDHKNYVAAFDLGDLNIRYRYRRFSIRATARNIWDKEYYVLPYRPMPYRNFEINLKYQFNRTLNIE